ncbi:MAG: IS21 family transposase [Acidobacteriota bacterium]
MTKFKTILRLASLGLSQRQIAQSCQVGQATISDYLAQAKQAQLRWPDIADWDEDRIQQALAPAPNPAAVRRKNAEPNFAAIRRELQVHKHLTLQLLWEEYQLQNPDGYRYSRFCDLYRHWLQHQDVVLRQEHRAGEKLFVDYAGDTLPVTNPVTGERQSAAVFVAVLGASNYTFAEATWTQSLPDWIGSHLRAFEFLGGVPAIAVPDNLKAGVTRACRYEPELNRTYEEMAAHYGVAIIPARRRKPRDKAKVEAGVLVVERWIMAALRQRQFFSLRAVNAAITELLTRLNDRPFRKADGTRRSWFLAIDKPALRPLPVERYEYGDWASARVNIDYHVAFEGHFYSVPYRLVQEAVQVRAAAATIEIFHKGIRVASHPRSRAPNKATTADEHRPKAHQRYLQWTPSRLIEWGRTIGPLTAELVARVLESKRHPEQGFRSCLGIIRLGEEYGAERVEAAARRALKHRTYSSKSLASILETGLDTLPDPLAEPPKPPLDHPNIRGANYFDPPSQEDPSC